MEALFLKLLNMSIAAGWLVLVVLLLRLLLKKAPKAIAVVMWAFVGIRLLCPFSFESILSLIPSAETIPENIAQLESPAIHSGISMLNSTVNPMISKSFVPSGGDSVNPLQVIVFLATVVWLVGMAVMLLYTVVSYIRIYRRIRESIPLQENVWLCDRIAAPFLFGVVCPRIYLPADISEKDQKYVIAHEKAHEKRHDHWWKLLGFLLLTVYWFQPVLWLAYILFCRDLEIACDEKVIRDMGTESKKDYAAALINCSMPRKTVTVCPLAFGEVGVKSRIQTILRYKKPAFWVVLVSIAACIALAVGFLTNPAGVEENGGNSKSSLLVGDADSENKGVVKSYYCKYDFDLVSLRLSLDDKSFLLSPSPASSYCAFGNYEEDENYVILNPDMESNKFIFKKDGEDLIYLADQSNKIETCYYFSETHKAPSYIPDRAVFKFSESYRTYFDQISADIDQDGIVEECELGYGPTSGIYTFTFSVWENGTLEYFNIFTSNECYDLNFKKTKENKIYIQGAVPDQKMIRDIEINIQDGNIVLSTDGDSFDFWGAQGIDSAYAPD